VRKIEFTSTASRFYALIVIVVLQFSVIGYQYVLSQYPLWIGQEVKLKITPRDPRSLFRGNYARLIYQISRLPVAFSGDTKRVCPGDRVYVLLEQEGETWTANVARLTKPSEGLFIKGHAMPNHCIRLNKRSQIDIRYGIEAYFAPKEKALELERRRGQGMNVILFIAPDGQAALERIVYLES